MAYRVIQWATGNVGRAAIEGILSHPELELVGAWVHSEAKVGRDVGEICGVGPIGVCATNDVDALLATDADCVLYSPIMAQTPEVIRILASGKNVVTPLGWFFPFRMSDVTEVEEACREGGVTLHGTGIHPGGITERFPLVVSGLSREIRHVRAEEFSDIRTYDAEFVVRELMLFGKSPEEARQSPMLRMLGSGFQQSIDMVAHALGMRLDSEKLATQEMAVATAPIDTPWGAIEPGTVAAQRFTWQGTVRGEPVITVRVNWLMGEENLDPAWRLDGERFEVEVTGDPPVRLTFEGLHPESLEAGVQRNAGVVATAMHCVSAIPAVCEAAPGIRTYLDLPMYAGRAAPDLLPES
ncbi:MAG: dihydrodipicolinate reductase [Myxococcota bacterium]|nr:dihydrodipicolinate reductase [Deltaproteobacteria bacterium]MCP4239992.1 dihydrodipicolinate reductase [bacterium]MDP6075221.1 dihydrodipicolinate reductase [Myxococcota bacterium]MDP6244144.1 dihydrodipicolinate reductase [Myxococcota bacterium]MDP7075012.1 dihydrodipicolinate reductase [Myxococcota bacterium]